MKLIDVLIVAIVESSSQNFRIKIDKLNLCIIFNVRKVSVARSNVYQFPTKIVYYVNILRIAVAMTF